MPLQSSPDDHYGHAASSSNGQSMHDDHRGDAGTSAAGPSIDGGQTQLEKKKEAEEKSRRAYRACANCRARKAKCDLGDIDNPKDPPCARCKREKRECTFLPSRRGGNLAAKAKAKQEGREDDPYDQHDPYSHDPSSSDSNRRTSFTSADGSSKRPRIDDGVNFPFSDNAGRQRSTSDLSHWSSGDLLPQDLNMWGALPSVGQHRSPLVVSGTLPTMQASPLGFTPQLTAPNFAMGLSPTSASNQISPYQAYPNPLPAVMPPPERTTPSFTHAKPYPVVPSLDQPTFDRSQDVKPSTYSHPPLPPPPPTKDNLSLGTALPAPGKPPLQRRPTNLLSKSRPEDFVVAGMANEADALSLLAMTATGEKPKGVGKSPGTASEPADTPDGRQSERSARSEGSAHRRNASTHAGDGTGAFEAQVRSMEEDEREEVQEEDEEGNRTPPPLVESDLIRKVGLTPTQLAKYVDQFFRRHHQIFPMIPASRMPKNELELQRFAHEEKHLLSTMVIIASRHDSENPTVHEKAWEIMSGYINTCVVNGRETCVGFVESMLLLSENLPRQEDKDDLVTKTTTDTKTWDDSTQSWFLVGHAVRTGYLLGLDQQTLYVDPNAPTTPEIDRERLAWTYCYLFDRHISLRIGKAFWSRGPGLCFTPNDANANFPSLRPIPGVQDDLASVVQALVELTQQMTTAHDVLYPSNDRTISLVRGGVYYRHLDDFTRSINGFEAVWRPHKFNTFPCSEIIWATFHYLRLYIYAFAFQAHVQRADEQGISAHSKFGGLFPRGTTQSPDAKFIFESIDAARQLLELCTERLHPGGALPYLPARLYMWFTYSSVFLLKAIYSGAVSQDDTRNVVELIQKVIFCLANASPDKQHLGIRHALLLRTVMKTLRNAFHTAEWVTHTGTATPLFPERWHVPMSRPTSPDPTGSSSSHLHHPTSSSADLPPSPWPGGLSHLASTAGLVTPSFIPDPAGGPSVAARGGGGGGGGGQGDHRTSQQDWLADFGDLLGSGPVGGAGEGLVGGTGVGELAFLDMEFGSSWWTNVLPPEGNQGR